MTSSKLRFALFARSNVPMRIYPPILWNHAGNIILGGPKSEVLYDLIKLAASDLENFYTKIIGFSEYTRLAREHIPEITPKIFKLRKIS